MDLSTTQPLARYQLRRNGYVLACTMIILIVVSIWMVALGRRSIHAAADANQLQRDLQVRWTMRSAQKSLAPRVATILVDTFENSRRPRRDFELTMGGVVFHNTAFDESAKLNPLHLLSVLGPNDRARELTRIARARHLVLRSDREWPAAVELTQAGPFTFFEAHDDAKSAERAVEAILQHFTVWSEGRLAFAVTPDETLRIALAPHVDRTTLERLLSQRRDDSATRNNPGSLRAALDKLALRDTDRRHIESVVCDDSSGYGLWTRVRSSSLNCDQFVAIRLGGTGTTLRW